MRGLRELTMAFGVCAVGSTAFGGFFKTITIDDAYLDWDDVPVASTDALDNPGFIDIAEIQIANDNDFLYIRQTFHTANSLGLYTGIDIDEDTATGFNIFGIDAIGQDAGWQNDFPFTSGDDVFNDGNGLSGDFFGSGAANLLPFADVVTRELAISLDVTLNEDGSALFPDDTVKLLFWTDTGQGDVSDAISYTLAVPEPTSAALIGLGGLALLRRRR